MPHPIRHQIQKSHVSKDINHVFHDFLVPPPHPAMLSDLGEGRLVRPDRDTITKFPLVPDFSHAKQQMCGIALCLDRIRGTGVACIDRYAAFTERLRLTARSILSTDDLRQRISAADSMKKAEGVTDITLPARIRTHSPLGQTETSEVVSVAPYADGVGNRLSISLDVNGN